MRTVTDRERRARIGVRHALAARVSDVEHAARAVTCLHATEPASVYLSAFARCGASKEQIATTLYDDRSVVRQLAMRRTVFAFPRDLLPAVRGSASARVAAQLTARLAKDIERTGIAVDGAAWLADVSDQILTTLRQQAATTMQLRARLDQLERRIVAAGARGDTEVPIAPRLLSVLAAGGSVVRGDNAGSWKISRPVWTPVEQWLDDAPATWDDASGYAELVRRWLWSFGPGTEADLVWWLGATKAAVRRALGEISAVEVRLEDDSPAWLHPDDVEVVAPPRPWAALLPALDPTTMGWKRRAFYLGDHAGRIFDRNGNGGPTAWWNGRIVGGWTQDDDGAVILVPAEPLPRAAEQALARRAGELTTWLGGDVVRSIYQSPLARTMIPTSAR